MALLGGRARLLVALGAACGCLTQNPAYDGETGAPGTSTAAVTTGPGPSTSTSTSTSTTTTGTSDPASGTVGDDESSTGTTTITLTTTGAPDTTTGAPLTAELSHYDRTACVEPLWCYAPPNIWSGLDGEVRGAECFDSPVPPPYRVRRIDYTLVAVRDQAHLRFQVLSGDLQQVLYKSESLGLPVSSGSLQIPAALQPVLAEPRFCVGFVGGDMNSTIGIGADPSALPPDQQSYFGSDACDEPGLRDVNLFVPEIDPHGAWCLGAEVAVE
ncbi:hypothetical protein [Nannocystis pusilla]|uniref:GON domain-containing protein n=1 Tax=Nannocystis pusilla TaxID=889268 RepID=A0ABS7U424_9BACT|nr:hypothetical protein [Nannocystis pusilla]MBZ5715304.1 hypothetical protein [Nannocystis pusilla]